MNRIVEILTSYDKPKRVCTLGNAAIARGAIEAGVQAVFAYPGTPSTDISEVFNQAHQFLGKEENRKKFPGLKHYNTYFEYSVNEKVALEKAIAFSIAGKKALCIMKNVGLNVASDALMTITYQKISAPLVIVVCDDPGCHSSSNEQDSRYWGPMAAVPLFNPSTPAEAFHMTKAAMKLSGSTGLPAILRTTTRVSHNRGVLIFGKIDSEHAEPNFERAPEHVNVPARTAVLHQNALKKLHNPQVAELQRNYSAQFFQNPESKLAVISSGVATCYLKELIADHKLKIPLLDLGLVHPFPEEIVSRFLGQGFSKVLVVEELDPLVETQVRALVQKHKLKTEVAGKGFSVLVPTGELNLDMALQVLTAFTGKTIPAKKPLDLSEISRTPLPPRPPVFCSGCPHRATYYALKLLIPRDDPDYILCGDIGCFGLGALPPYRMVDTLNHMGMSISMAQGLSQALEGKNKKVISLQGDGTFFHSGMTSLLNAVYSNSNMLLIIFDNRTVGMTGQQPNAGSTGDTGLKQTDLAALIKGLGVGYVETLMPFEMKDTFVKMEKALEQPGTAVLISQAPCVFLPGYKEEVGHDKKVIVDPLRCNACHNNPEPSLHCSRMQNPASSLKRAINKLRAGNTYSASDYSCPANICNLGFFQSILEDNAAMALQTVRDKILFARSCGDLCHRPCELFSSGKKTLPIKALKKYVSSSDEDFEDFSIPVNMAQNAEQKNVSVAIVGAGPAGLSAAYDLVREGYHITVFEKDHAPGGLIRQVIPTFRMDKKGFETEAMQLKNMGVEFHFNCSLGKEISMEELRRNYDEVILAIGLGKVKPLNDAGGHLPADRWSDCLTFLRKYNDNKLELKNKKILVVGGGNSGMDSARVAARLDKANYVTVVCPEPREEMPAFSEEIDHAVAEGIRLLPGTEISGFSLNGDISVRFKPLKGKPFEENFDFVISAIGQMGDAHDLQGMEGFLGINNRLIADEKTGKTAMDNVFVAGDLFDGNHQSLIGAIGSGKRAATGIRRKREKYPYDYPGLQALLGLNDMRRGKELPEPKSNLTDRKYLEQFHLLGTCAKCNHCIDNFGCPALVKVNGKVQVIDALCNSCGLCIDVCPNDAIQWE